MTLHDLEMGNLFLDPKHPDVVWEFEDLEDKGDYEGYGIARRLLAKVNGKWRRLDGKNEHYNAYASVRLIVI